MNPLCVFQHRSFWCRLLVFGIIILVLPIDIVLQLVLGFLVTFISRQLRDPENQPEIRILFDRYENPFGEFVEYKGFFLG